MARELLDPPWRAHAMRSHATIACSTPPVNGCQTGTGPGASHCFPDFRAGIVPNARSIAASAALRPLAKYSWTSASIWIMISSILFGVLMPCVVACRNRVPNTPCERLRDQNWSPELEPGTATRPGACNGFRCHPGTSPSARGSSMPDVASVDGPSVAFSRPIRPRGGLLVRDFGHLGPTRSPRGGDTCRRGCDRRRRCRRATPVASTCARAARGPDTRPAPACRGASTCSP